MEDWAKRLDGFLEFNGNEILTGAGKISHEQAKLHAETKAMFHLNVIIKVLAVHIDKVIGQLAAHIHSRTGRGYADFCAGYVFEFKNFA